ncbi:MAG: methyltransferase [Bulleidia sp.]|nr:methyltransferase [Bulleidia sp.]
MFTDQVHYFTDNRNLTSNRREFSFRFSGYLYTFTTDDGVFSKNNVDYGSYALLKAIENEDIEGNVLDFGCGYGAIGVILQNKFTNSVVISSDINSRAVELANINYQKNGMHNKAIVSDGFTNIKETFDWIMLNPPIRTGKANIYHMFEEAYSHLNDAGKLVIVIQKKQGAESAIKKLETLFSKVEIIEKNKGYWIIKSVKQKIDGFNN